MKFLFFAAAAAAAAGTSVSAQDRYIGEVFTTAASYCPRGTEEANGQLLQISQYQAGFALLGTTYGGDGRTTFALPDLRARAAVHVGQGPGTDNVAAGERVDPNASSRTIAAPSAPTLTRPDLSPKPASPAPPTGGDAGVTLTGDVMRGLGVRHCVVLVGVFPSRS